MHFAHSGEDALGKLAGGVEATLIAILPDINMPVMDRLDLPSEVKRRYPALTLMMVPRTAMTNAGAGPQNWAPLSFSPSGWALTSKGKTSAITQCR
jgi:CheY-like chemotaxis protein